MADTHSVMPKKLAQALMEAGVQHFDAGGLIGMLGMGNNFQAGDINQNKFNNELGHENDVYKQQQALASQLLAQTQGTGPGQQLIAQQAGNNAAQQGALMASARGASANPALIARQSAMAGAGAQQQGLNAQAALQLQSQGALQQQQAQMANQALQGQSILYGAQAAANNVNAQVAGQNASANQGLFGGLVGGLASGLTGGLIKFDKGGQVPQKMAVGGPIQTPGMMNYAMPNLGLDGGAFQRGAHSMSQAFGTPGTTATPGTMAGGPMDQMTTPGGNGLALPMGITPEGAAMFASHGGKIPFGQMLAGGPVPGQAETKGDSEQNDVVPTMLSPGEIVLPRSVAQAPDAERRAAEFVAHLRAKRKMGYGGVVEARKARK